MRKTYTMREALEDPELLGSILPGKSWAPWRIILIAAMGEKLTFWERRIFKRFTGRSKEPGQMVSELVAIAGRRAGKSRAASALACYLAALCDWSDAQAVGETLRVLFLAKDVFGMANRPDVADWKFGQAGDVGRGGVSLPALVVGPTLP